ncbi:hypothetical protein BGX31_004757, partial [Mortierella sp. GBA43]
MLSYARSITTTASIARPASLYTRSIGQGSGQSLCFRTYWSSVLNRSKQQQHSNNRGHDTILPRHHAKSCSAKRFHTSAGSLQQQRQQRATAYTFEELRGMTTADLRTILKDYGLRSSGRKTELMERILACELGRHTAAAAEAAAKSGAAAPSSSTSTTTPASSTIASSSSNSNATPVRSKLLSYGGKDRGMLGQHENMAREQEQSLKDRQEKERVKYQQDIERALKERQLKKEQALREQQEKERALKLQQQEKERAL